MRKRFFGRAVCALLAILCLTLTFGACNDTVTQTTYFDYSNEKTDENPDRGLRGEVYLTLGRYTTWPGNSNIVSPTVALDDEIAAYPEKINIVQLYVYLIDFYDKDLSDEALQQLKNYFEYVKSKNVKVLLRFAYEYDESVGKGPTNETIERHAQQLKNWLENDENLALFKDVVYSVQLGMIGLWGEGHTSVNPISETRVMRAMADWVPEPYTIMLRYYSMYTSIPDDIKDRFALHEDWLVGEDMHEYDFFQVLGYIEKNKVLDWCKTTLNDVEMPWGDDENCGEVAPLDLIKEMKRYAATSLSIAHNYIEDGEENEYNLARYKNVWLSEQELKDNALPYSKGELNEGKVNAFEYIKAHLGYMLCVDSVTKTGNSYSFEIVNRGFGVPKYFEAQIVDEDGNVLKEIEIDALASMQSVKVDCVSNKRIGCKIVSKINDCFSAKFACDMKFENGVNWLEKA